jgi:hypothetical protein
MSIPVNAVAPNLPLPPEEYQRLAQQTLTNVLRLYFNQLDAFNAISIEQMNANQTLTWLSNG